MCGRYALRLEAKELIDVANRYDFDVEKVDKTDQVKPRLNIAPQSLCWVLIPKSDQKGYEIRAMRWSLQPAYATETVKYPTFNTRIESLDPLKPTWQCAKENRCVVFMEGYYEWHRLTKLPFYVHSKRNRELMCCLAIWDGVLEKTTVDDEFGNNKRQSGRKTDSAPQTKTPTFSILTMPAPTEELNELHGRTPIIVNPKIAKEWMGLDWNNALQLITTLDQTQILPLTYYRVSTAVNSVKIEKPDLNKEFFEKKITDFFKRKAEKIDSKPPKKAKDI